MMSAKMGTVNDEDMIRMAFRVLDKDGRGTIKSSAFKHLMTHIGKLFISTQPQHLWFGILDFSEWYQEMNFKSDLGMLRQVKIVVLHKFLFCLMVCLSQILDTVGALKHGNIHI